MAKHKKKLLMLVVVILFQVLFPLLTIIVGDKIILKSNAQNNEIELNSISQLNIDKEDINSHENDTENSSLELNFRDKIELARKNLDSENVDLNYIAYPRLKKLTKQTEDGYKYLLTFQNCITDESGKVTSSNGKNIYYTISKDLKTWDIPKKLYSSETKTYNFNTSTGVEEKSITYNFSSCDTFVLDDGRIMAVAAKVGNIFFYPVNQFNECGIYARYSSDNGVTWTEAEQIYSGLCWEPSILQLASGEIHVYFTHSAHVEYMNGYKNALNGWIVRLSSQSQSGSVAMISSIDKGKTWSPNIEGVEADKSYNSLERNPYSAYIIAQQPIKRLNGNNDAVNFKNLYYWSSASKIWQKHLGIKLDADTVIKMTDQMPVAIELNNKDKIVMAMESSLLSNGEEVHDTSNKDDEYTQSHTTKYIHDISLAYSGKKNVLVNGKKIGKYWLDLDEEDAGEYEKEEDIYDGEGLGTSKEGPINRISNMCTGAAPYIQQFPSGETVLSYSENDANSEYYRKTVLSLGNTEGEFFGKNLTGLVSGTWNSMTLLSSHCMGVSIAKASKAIEINPMYLNHTINAEYISDDTSWNNTQALFIGSESQAQATIRVAYDNNSVYFLIDRLDKSLTDEDTIELYINTESLNNNNYKYCKIILSKDGVKECYLYDKNNKSISVDTTNIKCSEYINDTNDEKGGYRLTVSIPRQIIGVDGNININAILNNKDIDSELVSDTFTNVTVEDTDTWNKVRLINNKDDIGDKDNIDNIADKELPKAGIKVIWTSICIAIIVIFILLARNQYKKYKMMKW